MRTRNGIPEGMAKKVWESDYVQFPWLLAMLAERNLIKIVYVRPGCWNEVSDQEIDSVLQQARKKWKRIMGSYEKRGEHAVGKKTVQLR